MPNGKKSPGKPPEKRPTTVPMAAAAEPKPPRRLSFAEQVKYYSGFCRGLKSVYPETDIVGLTEQNTFKATGAREHLANLERMKKALLDVQSKGAVRIKGTNWNGLEEKTEIADLLKEIEGAEAHLKKTVFETAEKRKQMLERWIEHLSKKKAAGVKAIEERDAKGKPVFGPHPVEKLLAEAKREMDETEKTLREWK